jgi:hypothetical protein
MANDDQQKPARTQADKERSRQQSRAVSGKEAARGVQGQPGRGQRPPKPPAKGAKRPQGAQAKAGGPGRGRPVRPPAKGGGRGRPPQRSRTALYTWGAVGLVIVVVVVLVVVNATKSNNLSAGPGASPLTSTIAHQITTVPESVFNTVGVTSATVPVNKLHKIAGQKVLTFDGKPGVFYMGGDFCPFCAAQRWAIAAALARFGKFTGLETMESSSTDTDPDTQTITFAKAKYTSPYITAELIEYYSNVPKSTGSGYTVLHPLTKAQAALVTKYDVGKYAGTTASTTTRSGSIPFFDVGDQFVGVGASYRPTVLQGLKRTQISGGLSDASNPVTQAIVAVANYMSAAICSIDGAQPAAVCTGAGVSKAAKSLGLKL